MIDCDTVVVLVTTYNRPGTPQKEGFGINFESNQAP